MGNIFGCWKTLGRTGREKMELNHLRGILGGFFMKYGNIVGMKIICFTSTPLNTIDIMRLMHLHPTNQVALQTKP